ncbi:class I SAM-dependent methyltransferase [Corallococcus carmarthensis]|nr:class I SAM-dependent methyltransferase [Corallococcus carmarthensis]
MSSQYDLLAKLSEATAAAPYRKYFEEFTFFNALGDVAGRTVLDVACGTGLYSRRLKRRGASRVLGVDASQGMIDYACHLERESPLGIEYVVQDAAHAEALGLFDVVVATYLLHYAPTRQDLGAMCAMLRRSLAPGNRLVSICMNPDVQLADPGYYRPYGFEVHSRGQEGDEARLSGILPDLPFTLVAYHWSRPTYEAALRDAGFRDITWRRPEVSPEGLSAMGASYWDAYLRQPHAAVFTCVAA